ncbi:MAG: diguanylate cyclase [Blastocatellia bacterium]|nr:diguanylate cyclase [Blastocatellia bacterium]
MFKERDGVWTSYTVKDGLPHNEVTALCEDTRGNLWIGTRGGLARLAGDRFVSFTEKDGLVGGRTRCIYEDRDGDLWIGTFDSGLSRHRDGQFTSYTTREGLFNNGVFQILEDSRDNFWISCNRGIYRVSRKQLNDYADGKVTVISCVAYGKPDGMLSIECNGEQQPAGIKAQDGKLWFPTQGGVVVIDPELVPYNSEPPPVLIESVMISGKTASFENGVVLEPGLTDLEINYSAPGSVKAEYVQFKYRLVGLDDQWTDTGRQRAVRYSHLPPGRYSFKVIAANSDGVWNETGATLEIYKRPYFYQTGWFFALCVAAFLIIVASVYALRVQRLKANERRLTRIVAERTAELVERTEQLEVANDKLKELASLDGLTNIPNRRCFAEFLHQEWMRSVRSQTPLSLLLMDVDHFKAYNDTYGHQSGDECLKRVAAVLNESIKRPTDLAARYGGEEFVVVLSDTDKKGALKVAETIRSRVETLRIPHSESKVSQYVTLSIGVATAIPRRESGMDDLVSAADQALYRAKENGRNRCWEESEAWV